MMTQEESKIPKRISSNPVGDENRVYVRNNGETDQSQGSMFSPRFKSVVAMAGWDEEALLLASLVVEDTPERDKDAKNKNKRSEMLFKTPPSNLRRKKRVQRRSPVVNPVTVLNLDDDNNGENSDKEGEIEEQRKTLSQADQNDAKKLVVEEDKQLSEQSGGASCSCSTLLNMEKLREELSCAICLELCFEPSTTPCGHSFCKKCLRSAADKCGKRCPKCRQLISNGRYCTVNTVLWNTIQLLFPIEVETREAAGALTGGKAERQRPTPIQTAMRVTQHDHGQRPTPIPTGMRVTHHYDGHHRSTRLMWPSGLSRNVQRGEDYANGFSNSARRNGGGGGRRAVASQEDDAALALRLQREEFMTEYTEGRSGVSDEQHRNSTSLARANLRAMASRAINIRLRNRAM